MMRTFPRSERDVLATFRSRTDPPTSSTTSLARPADQDRDPAATLISTDHARGSLSPEEGSRGDTLLPMLVGGLVFIILGIGAVLLVV